MAPLDRMRVIEGDITAQSADVIVNAANEQMTGGSGVNGAIRRAAGPELDGACAGLGPCAPGDARITPAFKLDARYIVHAVGPIWNGGTVGEDTLLAAAYRRSLELAAEHGARSVVFPAISTGIYGFPPERAAPIAVKAVADTLTRLPQIEEVVFCCFGHDSAAQHRAALAALAARS